MYLEVTWKLKLYHLMGRNVVNILKQQPWVLKINCYFSINCKILLKPCFKWMWFILTRRIVILIKTVKNFAFCTCITFIMITSFVFSKYFENKSCYIVLRWTSDVSLVLPSDSLDKSNYKSIKWNLDRLLYGKIDCIWLINW